MVNILGGLTQILVPLGMAATAVSGLFGYKASRDQAAALQDQAKATMYEADALRLQAKGVDIQAGSYELQAVGIERQAAGYSMQAEAVERMGEANAAALKFNSDILKKNAQEALRLAEDAIKRGEIDEGNNRIQGEQAFGRMRAAMGASGIVVDVGSSGDFLQDMAMINEMDALTIRSNAREEAQGRLMEGYNYTVQAAMKDMEGANAIAGARYESAGLKNVAEATLLGAQATRYQGEATKQNADALRKQADAQESLAAAQRKGATGAKRTGVVNLLETGANLATRADNYFKEVK